MRRYIAYTLGRGWSSYLLASHKRWPMRAAYRFQYPLVNNLFVGDNFYRTYAKYIYFVINILGDEMV